MLLSAALSGCLSPQDGQFACPPPERACPAGLYCDVDGLCRAMPRMDAGGDAGRDAGRDAASVDAQLSDGSGVDGGCASDTDCGEPFDTFDTCLFADTCSTTGTRLRTLHTPTCSGGACTTTTTMDTVACTRGSTDGTMCGATTSSDGACTRSSECGAAGTFVRTTTTFACSGGSCVPTPGDTTLGCSLAGVADATPCSAGYCCSGSCVARSSNNHCGVCGMDCTAAGQTCTSAISNNGTPHALAGAWVCTCPGTNSTCVNLGYGPSATCFGGHCQCQCAGSGVSCGGQCFTGTCFEDTIEPSSDNFCGY